MTFLFALLTSSVSSRHQIEDVVQEFHSSVFLFSFSQAKRVAAAKAQNPAPVHLTLTETVEFHLQTEDRGFTHRVHREQVGF